MKMNALRCKTVARVMKELAVYLLVYNLIRLLMLRAAEAQGVEMSRISFVDAMRLVAAPLPVGEYAAEAKPLQEELSKINEGRRRGPQPLGEILPAVLAMLGVTQVQSSASGSSDPA